MRVYTFGLSSTVLFFAEHLGCVLIQREPGFGQNRAAAAAGTQVFAIPVALADDMLATRPESMQVYVEQIKLAGEIHLKARNALLEGAAPQRYQWFLQTYPGVADQVSGKIIASFLGITPVTLSRLRRSMRQEAGGGRNDPT